ncbi:hypothetical protein O181_043629 [Austropuccinia psidii MF-1]|uniref:Retrovirus-related Pol polyprotein from transposon TNT 1-94-like beta-barrel domain-containing protein n=1 Tax=Austropuccinia psidii MF-1 TaxID=1389203 RepID=A0A9Q3DIF0_9BASI|nr:hypothetical protein [Austropuccinia psidii MF-1]
MKRLYSLVLGIEDPVITAKLNKLDPERKALAFEIICLNCDVKLAGKFSAEANDDLTLPWTNIDNFYQPKTIQNQTTYLNTILLTYLPKTKLEEVLNKLLENTQQLFILINDKTTKPRTMAKKCEIEKRTPSLKDTIEELRSYIQRTKENIKNSKVLAAQQKENLPSNQRCRNNYPNPQAKPSEEDCSKLHPEKRPKNSRKTVKALLAVNRSANFSSFVLDSGATTSMVNHLKYFQDITKQTKMIKLADGSVIKALGTGTICLELNKIILTFKNSLYIPKLATNRISMAAFIKTNYSIHRLNKDQSKVLDHHKQEIVSGTLSSGNFVLDYSHPKAFASTSVPKNIAGVHQACSNPSIEYFRKMFPNKQIP